MDHIEIAYLRSGFVRVVQRKRDGWYEVQTMKIRGRVKHGPDAQPTFWSTLYGVHDLEKAILLLESYA